MKDLAWIAALALVAGVVVYAQPIAVPAALLWLATGYMVGRFRAEKGRAVADAKSALDRSNSYRT